MVNTVLVDYFREGLAKGNSVQILRKTLIDAGWPEVEVNAASNEIRPRANKPLVENKFLENPLKNDFVIRKRPTGVTLSAIWYWIMGFGGIAFLIIFSLFVGTIGLDLSIFVLIIPLAVSILSLFVGIAIWKGKKDGKVTAIAFGFLAVVAGVYFVIESLYPGISLILQLGMSLITFIIGIYLLFSRNAKEYFKKKI